MIVQSTENEKVRIQVRLADLTRLPEIPSIRGTPTILDPAKVKHAISSVLFAVIKEGSRPELNGVYLSEIAMCGDGIRLASSLLGMAQSVTVPSHAIEPLLSILSGSDLQMTVGDSWVQVRAGTDVLKFSKFRQEFPTVAGELRNKFLSKKPAAIFMIKTKLAEAIIHPLSLFSSNAELVGIRHSVLNFDGKTVYVSVQAPNMGEFENILPTESVLGGPISFLFSASSFGEILANYPGDVMEMRVFSETEPFIVTDSDEDWVVIQGVMGTAATAAKVEEEEEDDF